MKSAKTKISVFLTSLIVLFSLSSTGVNAQPTFGEGGWYNPSFNEFYNKVSAEPQNEIFGERYTLAQVNWIINSLAYLQAGSLLECFEPGVQSQDCIERVRTTGSSPIIFLANLNDGMMSTRPASGIDYVAKRLDRLSPVKEAYAQDGFGFGFGTLGSLQGLWVVFRNLSYGLMAFGVVILAILIILRRQVGTQTALTVQTALPRIAAAFLFITFSYAIAGFMVDLAYLVMAAFSAIISSAGTNLFQSTPNVIQIFNLLNDPGRAFFSWSVILGGFVALAGLGGFLTGGLMVVPSGIAGSIGLILLLLGLVALFRVFVEMLKAFATIVFLVIGSPFIGILSIFGGGPGFGGWVKQLAAQLSVFVTICLVMFLSHMMFWTTFFEIDGPVGTLATLGANYYNFNTGQIGGEDMILPGFAGFPIQIIGFFVGFGMIFSAPKIATSMRDQILTGRASYGTDNFKTMLGAGIPFVGGVATGQIAQLQKVVGGSVTDFGQQAFRDARRAAIDRKERAKEAASRVTGSSAANTSQSQTAGKQVTGRNDVDI
jgi:hypothetical protein